GPRRQHDRDRRPPLPRRGQAARAHPDRAVVPPGRARGDLPARDPDRRLAPLARALARRALPRPLPARGGRRVSVPSPAQWRKATLQTERETSNGRPAWLEALDHAFLAKCRELDEANAEIAKLRQTNRKLHERLNEANRRRENWKLRRAAWVRERNH